MKWRKKEINDTKDNNNNDRTDNNNINIRIIQISR
jgi:hypothetical protein